MASIKKAQARRDLAANSSVPPAIRAYVKQLNAKVDWGTTTTTTTTA